MRTLDDIVSDISSKQDAEFEERLRVELAAQDPSWLVDRLVERVHDDRHLASTGGRQLSRQAAHIEPPAARRERLARIRRLGLDRTMLGTTLDRYRSLDRATLEASGYLVDPPHKGEEALGPAQRSDAGEALLRDAHDLFYALLFCDRRQGVDLPRHRRDFLTITLPVAKAGSLERFMLAVTETQVAGTWLDPEGVSDDVGALNKILQVEFGDDADGLVSDALVAVLRLINDLEVNEEILYARIEELERSTLIS